MTTAAMVLAALLAVALVVWVARPLLVRDAVRGDEGPVADAAARERLALLEARDRALAALKELEFDHRTGKISDADYGELVGPLRREAAETLAALDAARTAEAAPSAGAERAAASSGPIPSAPAPAPRREEQAR